jgi:hypothetical protein
MIEFDENSPLDLAYKIESCSHNHNININKN